MTQNVSYLKSEEVTLQTRENIYQTINKPLNIAGTYWPEVVKNVSAIQQRTIEMYLRADRHGPAQIATATEEQTSESNFINEQITLINTDAQSVTSTIQ
ncbi:hypothetical protein P4S68_10955 [Pseudoalteromonas sp. Hal099]